MPNAVLLATDIAARGLDVPEVDHVVHYQIPARLIRMCIVMVVPPVRSGLVLRS